jgi:hypothetical protein
VPGKKLSLYLCVTQSSHDLQNQGNRGARSGRRGGRQEKAGGVSKNVMLLVSINVMLLAGRTCRHSLCSDPVSTRSEGDQHTQNAACCCRLSVLLHVLGHKGAATARLELCAQMLMHHKLATASHIASTIGGQRRPPTCCLESLLHHYMLG